jgi:hypothetical protein
MAFNNAELQTVLREIIDPQITDTVIRARVLWNLLSQGEAGDINARGVKLTSKVRSNYSMKWFSEGGIYPAGGNTTHINMTVNYARFAISTRLTKDVLENGSKTAIVNLLSDAVADDTSVALREMNQQAYGDGSGVKGVFASSSTTTGTFRSGVSDLTPDNSNYANSYGSSLLIENGVYDIVSGDAAYDRDSGAGTNAVAVGGTVLANITCSSKPSKTTAVFDQNVSTTPNLVQDGDMLVWAGSYGICINGLDYHISSGTSNYQAVSRNTYPELRCYVLNASNTALTVAMLYKITMQAKYLRGNDILDENYIILSSPSQVHQYALLGDNSASGYNGSAAKTGLTAMPDSKLLDYGYTMYKFAGLNWIEDPHCPDHNIFIILPSKIKRYEFKPLGMVFGGDGLAEVPAFTSAGVGSYTDNKLYTMTAKLNLGCKDPATAGMKITNLTPSGVNVTNSFSLT